MRKDIFFKQLELEQKISLVHTRLPTWVPHETASQLALFVLQLYSNATHSIRGISTSCHVHVLDGEADLKFMQGVVGDPTYLGGLQLPPSLPPYYNVRLYYTGSTLLTTYTNRLWVYAYNNQIWATLEKQQNHVIFDCKQGAGFRR